MVLDPSRPQEVIESWTFTIKYRDKGRSDGELQGLEVKTSDGSVVELAAVRKGLSASIRKVIAMCDTLPDLPGMDIQKIDCRRWLLIQAEL